MKTLIKFSYTFLLVAIAFLAFSQLSSRNDLLGQEPLALCCNNGFCDDGPNCASMSTMKSEALLGCGQDAIYDCKKCIDLQRQNQVCGHFDKDAYCLDNQTPYYVCPQVSVSISGPSQLERYQLGTFTASVSGGTSPFTYHWYKWVVCPNSMLSGGGGGPSPNSVPCGYWMTFGSNSSTAQTSAPYDFIVRVDVTDYCKQGQDPRTASAQHYVTVDGGLAKSETGAQSMSVAGEATTGKSLSSSAGGSGSEMRAYPNPFNPTTTINFTLLQPASVSLTVYNSRGQQVRGLISGQGFSAGNHAVVWDGVNDNGNNVASGMYLCRLSSGNNVKVIRLLLAR